MVVIRGFELVKKADYLYEVPADKDDGMSVPVRLFLNDSLLANLEKDDSLLQAVNVAKLPGIVGASIVMPDCHQGYGFSIGGVAAFDLEEGVISPGGIGFDINCGVRVLKTPFSEAEVRGRIDDLLSALFKNCPVGVGGESRIRISDDEYEEVLRIGARWAVSKGFGFDDDLLFCEDGGSLSYADPSKVSPRARKRGRRQLGTVGSGNHFIELQVVDEVFDDEGACALGLSKGMVTVMIHCGSRGLGHQVCTDYIKRMEDEQPALADSLPDKNLIYAPLSSSLASDYFGAMCAAANYAFANRHILGHFVRKSFGEVFGTGCESEISTLYDVTHNIAKREFHLVDGLRKELMVHRKGATRAFPPGSSEIPEPYRAVGQPVLVPGSMGTSSYILLGLEGAMGLSFGSSAHGAGRVMSRFAAKKSLDSGAVRSSLSDKGISLKAASERGVVEEAPEAYKDVDEVIEVISEAGIAKKVVRLKPLGVIKG